MSDPMVSDDSTVCVLRNGTGLDCNRYVTRTFTDRPTAQRWLNRQRRPASVSVVDRKVRVGDTIPPTERTRSA